MNRMLKAQATALVTHFESALRDKPCREQSRASQVPGDSEGKLAGADWFRWRIRTLELTKTGV